MHMADALVSPAVGGVMAAASVGAIGYSVYRISKNPDEKKVPMMGVMGAFIFAAQMINFTIPGTGSSGHIAGGILLAALIGPFPALLTMTAVLVIQALLFADGGLLALGCNIFNMGVVSTLVAYPLFFKPFLTRKYSRTRLWIASIFSAMIALQLGAFGVVLETEFSHITALPFSTFLVLMQPIHLAIGLVEGVITALVLQAIYAAKPELLSANLSGQAWKGFSIKRLALVLALCALVIGGGLSFFASSNPDGLEWSIWHVTGDTEVAAQYSAQQSAENWQNKMAAMPGYERKNASEDSASSVGMSGVFGGAVTLVVAGTLGVVITKIKKKRLP